MSILVSDIISRVAAQIDAEGSEYYTFDQDYKPAIRSAQDFVVGVINSQFGKLKFSEEIFQELTRARVWQTSNFSRVTLGVTTLPTDIEPIWTIIGVLPLPTTSPAFTPVVLARPEDSTLRGLLAHVRSDYYAARISAEMWDKNVKNPFMDGHDLEPGETVSSFGYLDYSKYTAGPYTVTGYQFELEIRPAIPNKPVTIRYIKVPSVPTLVTDSLEFPVFVTEIIVAATANFMSYKQSDNTTLSTLSAQLLQMLFTENT